MMFFMVFKSPAEGRTHIFRPNEPFAQFTVIPEESNFELIEMSEEEAAERELQARRIHESRATLSAGTQWTSASNTYSTPLTGVFTARRENFRRASTSQRG